MGAGRRAGAPAVPAVQQRDLDQSLDRQLDLPWRLRPRRKAPQPPASRSSRTTPSRSSSTTWKPPTSSTAAPASYMDAYNRRLDKGLSGSDVPHRAVVTALFERWGWKLGVLETLESGPPFTVIMAANTTNAFSAGPLRPNLLRDADAGQPHRRTLVRYQRLRRPRRFYLRQRAARRPSRRAALHHGRDAGKGNPCHRTLARRSSRRGLQSAESCNFDVPGRTLGAADFGVVSTARPARYMQLALRLSF